MEVAVVDCDAPTVEKNGLVDTQALTKEKRDMVDTEALTKEKRDMVNSVQITKLRPSFVTLRYKINDPNTKMIPFLPKKLIEKSNGEPVKFGRTENFDIFLNDECMSRNYAHIYTERGDPPQFKVVNFSSSKSVIVDNQELRQNESCRIQDKSIVQLDIITFSVSIRYGDKNAEGYIVSIQSEAENKQQPCRVPSFQVQNFGNCNLTCCTTPVCPQILTSSNGIAVYPQMHNSSIGMTGCPQIHSSSNGIPMCPQIHSSSSGMPMCPQIHSSSCGIPVSSQIHSSSSGIPVSPQIHNSSGGISPQIRNPSNGIPVSPHNPYPSNYGPVYPHMNIIQSIHKIPDKGSNRREPQEHSMPSEDAFLTEKQRQYKFIEDMSRKSSI